jgi:penicillin-binding protein 2
MRDESKKYKSFTRRALVIGGAKFIVMTGLASRYYYLQLIESDKYHTLSEKNRVKLTILPAMRGIIYDRYGEELVTNKQFFRITLDISEIKNIHSIIEKLNEILDKKIAISKEELDKMIKLQNRNSRFVLAKHVSWDDIAKIESNIHKLPGVETDTGYSRYYPLVDRLSHVTGYIGKPSEEEIEKSSLPNFQDFTIGKMGVERIFDEELQGAPGIRKVEVNAYGISVKEIENKESLPGSNLQLSVDRQLQEFTANLMAEREGAVVLIDSVDGSVLVMHSAPGYNPNEFVEGVPYKYWQQLISNPETPLINRNISIPYPPGSTFKTVTALAGLIYGINPYDRVYCSGEYRVGNAIFRCWKRGGHGHMNLKTALAQSCNPYFYTIGSKVGIDRIYKVAKALGLGSLTGVELPFENPGLMPNKQWKSKQVKKEWVMGDTINASIGHGFVLTTPMQLAVMVSRIISGRVVKPSIILPNSSPLIQPNLSLEDLAAGGNGISEEVSPFEELQIPERHLEVVRDGMNMVVNEPVGLVYRHQTMIPNFKMGGKTGTAQVLSRKNRDRITSKKEFKDHGLFVGFAPVHQPRYAIAVVVEHGVGGAVSAAPVAKQVFQELYRLRVASKPYTAPITVKEETPAPQPQAAPEPVVQGTAPTTEPSETAAPPKEE